MKSIIVQTCLPDYRLPLFSNLAAMEPDFHLCCGNDYFTPNLVTSTTTLPWRSFVQNHFLARRTLLWQSGIIRRAIKADVLVAEFNPRILSTWVILLLRGLAGRRSILWGHLRGQHGPLHAAQLVRRIMLKLADGMIFYTYSQAAEFGQKDPARPVWVASNSCVKRAECKPAPIPERAACIAYVGRMVPDKKPSLLLEAFAQALPHLPKDCKLLLVGDGDERAQLIARVQELALGERVELPGHENDPQRLQAIYARSLVAVSPGYVGLSAIQSMAYGVPMLVSRDEKHSPEIEACIEGVTCEFFKTDDTQDLAERLIAFFDPASRWLGRRSAISAAIAQRYTYEGMVEAFLSAIQDSSGASTRTVAVVWAQFGPYHLARLQALRMLLGTDKLLPIEIGNVTSTYDWRRLSGSSDNWTTLLPGEAVERVSARAVYARALSTFMLHNVETVFVPSYWPASSLAIFLAAKTAGARVVMMNDSHAHTAKARGIWAKLKQRLVLQFDAALVAGTPQKEYFSGLGLSPTRIVTGYDVIDNRHFQMKANAARQNAEAVRVKHGLPTRYFLNVGRMVWKKNLETLVDAYALVRQKMGATCPRLIFVGSGKLANSLRERCLKLGLSVWQAGSAVLYPVQAGNADVYFYGFRQVDDLPDFYALAECFILPSREEEWGLVVNEAMACGLPVLVSEVAGCAQDLVQPGENGFRFSPFDTKELARQLELIATEIEMKDNMGLASKRRIEEWGCERFAQAAMDAVERAHQSP